LSLRASEQKIVVVDSFATDGKTKSVATALKALGGKKTLIVDAKDNANLVRGAKNLATSQWLAPEGVNVYDILRHDTLVVTKAAVEQLTTALKGAE
ncbi:MAG TPA: 50S ribosomal protein L4, partial [Reyranellaceae bacterium]|nr:50S ribosomal protein L4 [Reyranellaceae bacterium]